MNHKSFFFVTRRTLEVKYPCQMSAWLLNTSIKVKQIACMGCGGLEKLTEGRMHFRLSGKRTIDSDRRKTMP